MKTNTTKYDNGGDDVDPSNMAVLYLTSAIEDGCGHVVEWNNLFLMDDVVNVCPVCQKSVGLICDARVATTNDERDDNNNTIVRFKYGKQIYQLSTIAVKPTKTTPTSSWIWSFFSRVKDSSSTSTDETTTILAQDRIREAMQFVDLKILHKGKVIYPCSIEEEKISQQLLDLSSPNQKISLVVMGTRQGRQLKEPPPPPKKNATRHSYVTVLFSPFTMFLKMSWLFLESFLKPFLPESFLISNGSNYNEYDNNHNHQD
jgi:hypothetical protein